MDFMWWRVRSGAVERMAAAYLVLPVRYICEQTGLEMDLLDLDTAAGEGKKKGKLQPPPPPPPRLGPMIASLLRHVDVEPSVSASGEWIVDFAAARKRRVGRR